MIAFAGPGYLVAVGYMDPGNWATDLGGGSRYGYTLLSAVLISSLMAIFLQALSAKLGIATGRDLAQACREHYSPKTTVVLWVFCEIAIAACDLAEVLGSAVALKLLFGLPLLAGVLLTGFDVLLVLALQGRGFRVIETLVVTLIMTIGACFAYEIFFARPLWIEAARGFLPTMQIVKDREMLYLAIGILGATVMPHNLYLHSSIVQTRAFKLTAEGKREADPFCHARFDHRARIISVHQCRHSCAGRGRVSRARHERRGGHQPGVSIAHAGAGRKLRERFVCGGAPVLRTKLHTHGDACRTNLHGRLFALASQPVAAAIDHAIDGYYSGGARHWNPRREPHDFVADFQPSGVEFSTALCRGAPHSIHERPVKDG